MLGHSAVLISSAEGCVSCIIIHLRVLVTLTSSVLYFDYFVPVPIPPFLYQFSAMLYHGSSTDTDNKAPFAKPHIANKVKPPFANKVKTLL